MADEPLIREMVAADLGSYKALRDLMLEAHPEAFTSDAATELRRPLETYLSRIAGMNDGGWPFTLTAWEGRALRGAVTCEREGRAKVRHIGRVVGMMVHPAAQGRGFGRALLAACIATARRHSGIEMLSLSVTAGNQAAAHLYEQAGFVRYGRLERAIKLGSVYHGKDLMVLYF